MLLGRGADARGFARLRGFLVLLAIMPTRTWWSWSGSLGPWGAANPERRALARVAAFLLLSRVLLALVAYLAVRLGAPPLHPRAELYFGDNPIIVGWLRWDVWWYVSIVQRGYWYSAATASNVAFLPLMPGLIGLLTPIFGDAVLSGLVVANLATTAAVIVFWTWVRERAGLRAAERAALWLLVYPFSFFFHTVYAEGLFFLTCTLALRDADRGLWLRAGSWACLATLTRPMGILLVPAFAWALLRAWRAGQRPAPAALAAVALPFLGLGAFAVYLWAKFGDPMASWKAHQLGWKITPRWNLPAYWHDVYLMMMRRNHAYMQVFDALQLLLPIPLVILCVKTWRRLGPLPGMYAALALAVALIYGPESLGREALAAVPIFAAAGLIDARGVLWVWLGLFALLVVFVYAFATGSFLG
jgi:hypothetical protein